MSVRRCEQGRLSGTSANTPTGGPDRVAGGAAMSKKTSTAALDSFRKGQLRNQRRAPRHPAGEERSKQVWKQRGNERAREFGQARIVVRREGAMNKNAASGTAGTSRV